MPPIKPNPNLAVERYRSFGDSRPNSDQLTGLIAELTRAQPEQINVAMALGECYLDLAVEERGLATHWVGLADKVLRGTLARADEFTAGTNPQKLRDAWVIGSADARLRLAEIGNWDRAAQGLSPQNNYPDLLKACAATLPLLHQGSSVTDPEIQKALREVTPVLLGERGLYLGIGVGWLGRLALLREDKRPHGIATDEEGRVMNLNWDAGISLDQRAASFTDPPIRLQVKGSKTQSRGKKQPGHVFSAYRQANIVPLSAGSLGFWDSRAVIVGCMAELEDVPRSLLPYADMGTILSTAGLNRITHKIGALVAAGG
jgi:hypothetical protein